jgi:hypothetical protein
VGPGRSPGSISPLHRWREHAHGSLATAVAAPSGFLALVAPCPIESTSLSVALLIVDEVGFQPLTRAEASQFFRLVSYRYERGATLITTNKAVKDWPEILAGDEAMAAALLDRLLHRCHVLNIRGRSYRLRDLERMLK